MPVGSSRLRSKWGGGGDFSGYSSCFFSSQPFLVFFVVLLAFSFIHEEGEEGQRSFSRLVGSSRKANEALVLLTFPPSSGAGGEWMQ